jgi:ribonuclease HI
LAREPAAVPEEPPTLFSAADPGERERPDEVVIFCDGGSRGNPGPAAIGAVVLDPSVEPPSVIASISERIGVTTNNVAEYRSLLAGLEAAAPLRARRVRVRADSKLVIEQVAGRWKVRHAHLRPLHARALALLAPYAEVDLAHVPREDNVDADALVNAALDGREPDT